MSVYAQRRHIMVASQLRPNKVSDTRVLDAFAAIPREEFIPKHLQSLAYIDEDLYLNDGRFMLEPMVLARLLQALEFDGSESILDIATACGYSTALLAHLGQSVVGIEANKALADAAHDHLIKLGIDNGVVLNGAHQAGYPNEAPYDAIVIEGAVAEVPETILTQLSEHGRLVAVMRADATTSGKATIMTRKGKHEFQAKVLFDAQTPILDGFTAPKRFEF